MVRNITSLSMKSKVVIIDGIIASGKSYTLDLLDGKRICKLKEPVDLYTNFSWNGLTFNPLNEYYTNPALNGVGLQLHVIDSLLSCMENVSHPFVVCERYITSVEVFTQTMLEESFISDFMGAYIKSKTHEALEKMKKKCEIIGVILLDTEVDTCLRRCISRARKEELGFVDKTIMKNYMTKLRQNCISYYENNFPSKLFVVKENDIEKVRNCIDKLSD